MSPPVTLQQALAELRTLDPATQQDALLILAEYDDPQVAETMLEVLPKLDVSRPGAGYVAAQLVAELARRGDQRVVEPAIALLDGDLDASEDDHQFETVACDAFRTLRATRALPYLQQALLSKRWAYHEEDVAEALAAIGGAAVEDVLLEALASRRPELKLAAVRALRTAGTSRALPAVEKAAKSTNAELEVASLGTLCVLQPDRAGPILERAIAAAATAFPLQSNVIRLVREVTSPDLSAYLVALVSQPAWEALRFQILAILVDRKRPEAAALLRTIIAEATRSPWPKAHAAALLLAVDYSDQLVTLLFDALRNTYEDGRDGTFHAVNVAGEAIIRALAAQTPRDPRRHVELVELLDAMRRERVPSFPRGRWIAAEVVKQIVGSDEYAAYDAWVARHRG